MKRKDLCVANGIRFLLSECDLNKIHGLINAEKLLDGSVLILQWENKKVSVIQGEKLIFTIDKITDSLSMLLEQHTVIYFMVIEEVYYFSIILCV